MGGIDVMVSKQSSSSLSVAEPKCQKFIFAIPDHARASEHMGHPLSPLVLYWYACAPFLSNLVLYYYYPNGAMAKHVCMHPLIVSSHTIQYHLPLFPLSSCRYCRCLSSRLSEQYRCVCLDWIAVSRSVAVRFRSAAINQLAFCISLQWHKLSIVRSIYIRYAVANCLA